MIRTLTLSLLFAATSYTGHSQSSMPLPEYADQVMSLNDARDTLTGLEMNRPTWKYAGGIASSKLKLTITSAKSPIRFNKDAHLSFVYKMKDKTVNPETYLTFYKFETSRKDRSTLHSKYGIGSGNVDKKKIVIEFKKVVDDVILVTIPTALEPGEYTFLISDVLSGTPLNFFSFGID